MVNGNLLGTCFRFVPPRNARGSVGVAPRAAPFRGGAHEPTHDRCQRRFRVERRGARGGAAARHNPRGHWRGAPCSCRSARPVPPAGSRSSSSRSRACSSPCGHSSPAGGAGTPDRAQVSAVVSFRVGNSAADDHGECMRSGKWASTHGPAMHASPYDGGSCRHSMIAIRGSAARERSTRGIRRGGG